MERRIKTEEKACPAGAINTFGGKWKPEIIYYLNLSPRRFNELRRLIPLVTQRMLTQQ
jgi:DNA-binding HxlR family transcriptional regulator